jgi:multidrug efflux system membrane fusion protein
MKSNKETAMNKIAGSVLVCFILAFILPATLWAKDIEATLQWSRRVELSTPVSGVVSEVVVNAGGYVRRGQPLLRLDERPFKTQVEKARAEVKRLEVKRNEAEQELKRAKEMHERDLIADHELELARIGFVTVNSEYQAAQAALTKAELNLEYSVVRAPFDCVVLQRHVEVGQTIVSTMQPATLFVLAEAGNMLARIKMTNEEISALSIGQKVFVKVADKKYKGVISRLGLEPVGMRNSKPLYEVDIKFSFDPMTIIRPGQSATAILP